MSFDLTNEDRMSSTFFSKWLTKSSAEREEEGEGGGGFRREEKVAKSFLGLEADAWKLVVESGYSSRNRGRKCREEAVKGSQVLREASFPPFPLGCPEPCSVSSQ